MIGALVALVFAAGCLPNGTPPTTASTELPTVTVTIAPVQTRSIPRSVTAVGTLNGYEEVTLAPKVGGRIVALPADVGDPVWPGQIVLEIDPTDARTEVERAKRALALELARLDLPKLLTKDQFKTADVPSVRKAQFAFENAEREYERIKKTGGFSDRESRAAETEYQIALASRNWAVSDANAGLTAAWLKKDELDAAEQKLIDCTLRAPVPTGWAAWAAAVGPGFSPLRYAVAGRMVSEGEQVQSMPVTPAYKLVIDHALKLRAAVPERHAPDIRIGQLVEVRVDAYADRVFPGRVARVNPTVDPLNRTFQLEIAVPNLDGKLKAGGFARAAVRTRTDAAVRTVPPEAVVAFAGVTKVFVIEGTAKAVEVQVGVREREWVEVIGDLPAGATVATSGFSQLVDGSPVKVRE